DLAATLRFAGTGRLHGISMRLAWNAAVAQPARQEAGALLDANQGVMMSEALGSVDVAAFGRGTGIAGEGPLATVWFHRIGAGDPGIRLVSADGRDVETRRVDLAGRGAAVAAGTRLRGAVPNPFRAGTSLVYSLAARGTVGLSIHGVDGRLI